MYDAHAALAAIDQHTFSIMACLLTTVAFAFIYFLIAFRMAFRQKVYVVPFVGAAVFFWHDLTFVLMYDTWFNVYDHWWVKMWWPQNCFCHAPTGCGPMIWAHCSPRGTLL